MLRKLRKQYTKDNARGTNLLALSFFDISYKGHQVESFPAADNGPILTKDGMQFNVVDEVNLEVADSPDWDIVQTGVDFTLQLWIKHDTLNLNQYYVAHNEEATSDYWSIGHASASGIFFAMVSGGTTEIVLSNSTFITDNDWHFISLTKSGTTYRIYLDGTRINEVTDASVDSFTGKLFIGSFRSALGGEQRLDGKLRDLQIIKGNALYTGLTHDVPPRGKMQLYSDTVLALPLSSESNTNINLAQTIVESGKQLEGGKVSVFDGTLDSYQIPNSTDFSMGSGDFTMEAIVKANDISGSLVPCFFGISDGTTVIGSQFTLDLSFSGSFRLRFFSGTSAYTATSSTSYTSGVWYHVAGVRIGNTLSLYVNGKLDGTADITGLSMNYVSTEDFYLGRYGSYGGDTQLNGEIKSIRITKSEALYTSNFTPSKELLKVNDNVVFLENFDELNSALFNGTDQWIDTPDHADFELGSQDFTIQYWFRTNGAFTQAKRTSGQIDAGATLTEVSFFTGFGYTATNNLIYGVVYSGSTPYPVSQIDNTKDDSKWHHYAFVREGDILRIFIDGVYVQDNQSMPPSTVVNNSSANLAIGRMGEYVNNSFDGNIKNFKMDVGVCLYPSETTFAPPEVFEDYRITDNTKLFVPFENDVLTDCSPSNHTLTNNGSVTLEANGYDKSGNAHTIQNNGDVYTEYFQQGDIRFDGSVDFIEVEQDANNVLEFDSANDQYIEIPHKVGVFATASTNYLQLDDSEDWNFGSGDFTISMWLKRSSIGLLTRIIGQSNVAGDPSSSSWYMQFTAGNQLTVGFNDSTITGHTANNGSFTSTSAWYHIAYVRDGDTLRVYIDGVHQTNTIDVTGLTINNSTAPLGIGRVGDYGGSTAEYYDGDMKNVMVVKGTCLHPDATTFTPPDRYSDYKLDNDNVKLFIDFNDQVTDRSISNHTVTNSGVTFTYDSDNPIIDNFDFGSNDFTIDFDVKHNSFTTQMIYLSETGSSAADNLAGWLVAYHDGNEEVRFFYTDGGGSWGLSHSASVTLLVDTWYHIAIICNGGNIQVYVDGVAKGSTVSTLSSYSSDQSLYAGRCALGATSPLSFDGKLKNVRVFNGEALWDSEFAPPETDKDYARQFNDNCALWLKGNDLTDSSRAVRYLSDAPIVLAIRSTEWVSGSTFTESSDSAHTVTLNGGVNEVSNDYWLFDGTGDYLSIPNSQYFNFASEPFTIEVYAYFNNLTSSENICQQGYYTIGVNGNWSLFRIGENIRFVTYDGQGNAEWLEHTGTVSATTWTHISVSRVGLGSDEIQIAIDGVSETFTVSKSVGNNDEALTFGLLDAGGNADFEGRMDDMVIIKGRGVRDGNFTPPARGYTIDFSVDIITDLYNPLLRPLDFGDKDFTIEFWVKFDTIGSSYVIYDGSGSVGYRQVLISTLSANNMQFSVSTDGTAWAIITSSTTYAADTWYHYACERVGGTTTLYENGIEVGTQSVSGALATSNENAAFGAYSAGTFVLDGSIVMPRITVGKARYGHNFIPPVRFKG